MWTYFKENEKVIMVILLILLAPFFAFTGIASMFFGAAASQTYVSVYGHGYSKAEYDGTRVLISRMMIVGGGPFVSRIQPSDQMVEQHLLQMEYAKSIGLAVGEEEFQTAGREAAKGLIAWAR